MFYGCLFGFCGCLLFLIGVVWVRRFSIYVCCGWLLCGIGVVYVNLYILFDAVLICGCCSLCGVVIRGSVFFIRG